MMRPVARANAWELCGTFWHTIGNKMLWIYSYIRDRSIQMKILELYPTGSFTSWAPRKLQELKEQKIYDSFGGGTLLFENAYIKLWEITLYPGERLPFSRKNTNYLWTCISGGQTVSYSVDGSINLYIFEKGDSRFFSFRNRQHISDVENTGKNIIVIHIIEYKHEKVD